MKDIMLDKDGDIAISENGDLILENSVRQKILIRVRWFLNEWRWDKEIGLPWMDEILGVKSPKTDEFEARLRETIFNVDEVTEVKDISIVLDSETRTVEIGFVAVTDVEVIREEMVINGRLWSD